MRFQTPGDPGDIQDRRGIAVAGAGLSLGGVVVVAVVSLLLGRSPADVLRNVSRTQTRQAGPAGPRNADEARAETVVRAATTDIQNFWTQALPSQANGRAFERTQLVLFTDATRSRCGGATAETGPFYCPADRLLYIDLGFYSELAQRFGAPGAFAQSYVLAHEFGHHIQNIMGIDRRVRAAQSSDPGQRAALSVQLELQADCLAGVWGASASQRGLLDTGEIEQGITAAGAIGDDRVARQAGRAVNPERFTHGSSAQRVQWFQRGLTAGNITACDTFGNGTMAP